MFIKLFNYYALSYFVTWQSSK